MSGQLLLLICINDLPEGLLSDIKLVVDNTWLFSIVFDDKIATDTE